ncbi:MAG: hypothetical protein R3258_03245 [Acidimicrobiia bacterium]|nr:hypothetical protein [Acidimicrobiia bacterium]
MTDDRLTAVAERPTSGRPTAGYLVAGLIAAVLIAAALFIWQNTTGTTAEQPARNQVEADVSVPIDPVVPGP